jgi:hypothetical protein
MTQELGTEWTAEVKEAWAVAYEDVKEYVSEALTKEVASMHEEKQ